MINSEVESKSPHSSFRTLLVVCIDIFRYKNKNSKPRGWHEVNTNQLVLAREELSFRRVSFERTQEYYYIPECQRLEEILDISKLIQHNVVAIPRVAIPSGSSADSGVVVLLLHTRLAFCHSWWEFRFL